MFEFLNQIKNLNILITSLVILFLSGCSELDVNNVETVYGDVFVFDSINVSIRYNATPGFKYPLMEYVANSVVHLTERGNLDTYVFKCEQGNINAGYSLDYISEHDPGFKFRVKINVWSRSFLNINSIIPYSLYFAAFVHAQKKEFNFTSNAQVEYYTAGIQPEQNSLQLTGPENRNYNPKFSPDGNWIYFQSSHDQRTIFRTDQNGNSYEKIADFTNSQLSQGEYGIVDDNHIAYVQNGVQFSSIVIKDLLTMSDAVYPINGNLWGSNPIKIPITNKFLNFTDPNKATDFDYCLVAADINSQKVDTLFKNYKGRVKDYTINPKNNHIYVVALPSNTYNERYDILEYDYITDQFSIYQSNINYIRNFRFFPNGSDYAFIQKDQNGYYNIFLNIAGTEKQLTFYHGDVLGFNLSPDGQYVVFSANRRNEIQSWKIKVN